MPLRIKTFEPQQVGVLNRWANTQEATINSHQTQLNNLQSALEKLLKANPSLKT